MTDRFVAVQDAGDGVRILRLDRPPMNALSGEMAFQLADGLETLRGDAGARAIVVWGGEEVFCAGADVKAMHSLLEQGINPAPGIIKSLRPPLDSLDGFPHVTIAAICGYALGGGLEIALACDFRIAATSARLGFPEITLGIFPGAGGTQRLARLVGPARAKWLILGGQRQRAADALAIGLLDIVVPEEEVLERSLREARQFATGALAAQTLAKRAIDDGLDVPLTQGLDLENRLFSKVYDTEDARTGIASFVEEGPGKATFAGH
jgi:enoyl-CoA hydratase